MESKEVYFLLFPNPKISFTFLMLQSLTIPKIKIAQNIEIKDVNWCTPFHEIEKVLLEYSIEQYGMEMHFNATQISKEFTNKNFNILGKEYLFLETKKYLTEIKSMLSIFKCID